MRMLHPKRRLKTQAPLFKNAGVVSGVVTCQDKTKAMPNHLAEKKSNKNDNQPSGTRVIGGVVTLNDKAAEAKPSCQSNFKKEFVRLHYKTKYNNMYCFPVLP